MLITLCTLIRLELQLETKSGIMVRYLLDTEGVIVHILCPFCCCASYNLQCSSRCPADTNTEPSNKVQYYHYQYTLTFQPHASTRLMATAL